MYKWKWLIPPLKLVGSITNDGMDVKDEDMVNHGLNLIYVCVYIYFKS